MSENKTIDCLFIGHNEMDFRDYEKEIRKMGRASGAFRDLNLNYINYNDAPYTASDIFNLFYLDCDDPGDRSTEERKAVSLDENFNAAIAYLGTFLDRRNLTFDYVNTFQGHKDELAQKLQNENIRTIAIVTTLYVSIFPILEIMQFIKKHNSSAAVIIGGPFIATQVRGMDFISLEYLFKYIGADFYVNSSQGEAALVDIIRALKQNAPTVGIPNIYYRDGDRYIATSVQEENNDLSQNMVNWNLFADRLEEYASARTAISCPFRCSFCGFPEHAGPYRPAAVEPVRDELNTLGKIESLKSVNFIDDTFNVPPNRFKEILRFLKDSPFSFKWNSHFRCQFADRETVELMKESGCEGVFLGIESGSDRILKNMNKNASVEKYLKGIRLLKEYDILTFGSFIIGFPGETDETVRETVSFIKEGGLEFFRTQLWYCDTLTPIWKKKDEYDIRGSQFEWSHATMDSKRASDIVEDIFMSVEDPVWVPQYNFECDGLFKILHRGFSMEEVKNFLKNFNRGVKEKLSNPSQKEISKDLALQMQNICRRSPHSSRSTEPTPSRNKQEYMDFDF